MIRLTDPAQIAGAITAMRTHRELHHRATLAEKVGMQPSQYGSYELGHRLPGLDTLMRIAAAADHDLILLPREITAGLAVLADAIPAEALAALAALQTRTDKEDQHP